jgi:hypothetical protein
LDEAKAKIDVDKMEKEKERQEILKKFKGKLRATKTRLATQSSALAKN